MNVSLLFTSCSSFIPSNNTYKMAPPTDIWVVSSYLLSTSTMDDSLYPPEFNRPSACLTQETAKALVLERANDIAQETGWSVEPPRVTGDGQMEPDDMYCELKDGDDEAKATVRAWKVDLMQ
jgi:hypothetical protein